jgi:hypothetical protein
MARGNQKIIGVKASSLPEENWIGECLVEVP